MPVNTDNSVSQLLAPAITPLLITYNEAQNIGRVLDKLHWAKRIVVIDSGSTDETAQIVSQYPQAEIIVHPFKSFADQCNFGLSKIRSEWVLSLDADYILSDELVEELNVLNDDGAAGYAADFVYCVYGRQLRGTLYPPRTVLYRTHLAKYENHGHSHKVSVSSPLRRLRGKILHDDWKPMSRWFLSQQGYAKKEADYLLASNPAHLSRNDRIRLLCWPAPVLVALYVLFAKGCILDGWPGWFYMLQRLLAETMLSLELINRRLYRSAPDASGSVRSIESLL